jgi:ABC-type multidrug transport system permease subunit
MKFFRDIGFLALNNLKIFTADRRALFFFIAFPFMFIVLFNFLLAGTAEQDKRLEIHMVTLESSGGLSRTIIDNLETKDVSKLKAGEAKFVWDKYYDLAMWQVRQRQLDGFILFPEDFSDGIKYGYGAKIEVIVNPEATNTRPALNAVAEGIASAFGLQQAGKNALTSLAIEGVINNSDPALAARQINKILSGVLGGVAVKSSPIDFEVEKIGEVQSVNPANFVIPGYLVMFVFMAAAISAEGIVAERQNNTLERLLAGSTTREAILGGLFCGTAAKGLVQIFIFWGVGVALFHIDLGTAPAAVILLSVLMVLMSSAFAILLATIAKTRRSASSMAVVTSLILAPLGGSWWPLFVTPKWMQSLAKVTPHGWANTGFNNLMVFGGDFSTAVPSIIALCCFTIGFFFLATLRFRTSGN